MVECLEGYAVEANGRCIARQFMCDGIKHAIGTDITEGACCEYIPESPLVLPQTMCFFFYIMRYIVAYLLHYLCLYHPYPQHSVLHHCHGHENLIKISITV